MTVCRPPYKLVFEGSDEEAVLKYKILELMTDRMQFLKKIGKKLPDVTKETPVLRCDCGNTYLEAAAKIMQEYKCGICLIRDKFGVEIIEVPTSGSFQKVRAIGGDRIITNSDLIDRMSEGMEKDKSPIDCADLTEACIQYLQSCDVYTRLNPKNKPQKFPSRDPKELALMKKNTYLI